MATENLAEILLRTGAAKPADLKRAIVEQRQWGGDLGKHLIRLGIISEETLVRALSMQLKIPAVALDAQRLDTKLAELLPEEFCRRNRVVCFQADHQTKTIDLALEYPNQTMLEEASVLSGYTIRPHLAASRAIEQVVNTMFTRANETDGMFDLSPNSPLRNDPRRREQQAEAAAAQQSTSRPPSASATPAAPRPPAPPQRMQQRVGRQGAAGESLFHITVDDLPAVDASGPRTEDRLARMEQALARNNRIVEWLLSTLVIQGILRREDVDLLLSRF